MSILISGCSTGIGLGTALFLKEKGYDVIATARTAEALQMLRGEGLKAVNLDVNETSSIHDAVKDALAMATGGIEVLINNAGFGQAGALEDISRDTMRAQFETNVFGLLELTNAVLPHMREQNKGLIINVSSILGLISLPFRGAYNASKYAVEAISDTLRLELVNTPINVSLIEPGPVESSFRDTCIEGTLGSIDMKKSVYKKQYKRLLEKAKQNKPSPFMKSPEAVAKKILRAITSKNPKPRYRVTLPAQILATLKHLLTTRMLDRLLNKVSRGEVE